LGHQGGEEFLIGAQIFQTTSNCFKPVVPKAGDTAPLAVAQLECALPGAAFEFDAPEAHKNTYCTVTGS